MKEKFYWKVVRVTESKTYTSACVFVPQEHLVFYKIGKKTTPSIGKLFVFKTRQRARMFRKHNSSRDIKLKIMKVKVFGTITEGINCVNLSVSSDKIKTFWDRLFQMEVCHNKLNFHIWGCSPNTFLVDSVIPVEITH